MIEVGRTVPWKYTFRSVGLNSAFPANILENHAATLFVRFCLFTLSPPPHAPSKFDILLLDPSRSPHGWTWETISQLPVPQLAADPSFVFMWVGDGSDEGLERGREVLAKWGYRRAEDIVWVRTRSGETPGAGVSHILFPSSYILTR